MNGYEPKTYHHIKCGICGCEWIAHDPACAGEHYRPPGSPRPITDTERLDFVFRVKILDYFPSSGVLFIGAEKVEVKDGDLRAAIDALIREGEGGKGDASN